MSTLITRDSIDIYYKDWSEGQPVVFSHGWAQSADAWDAQMVFMGERGFRVIAHDRRGHGRSSQTWTGNDMDTYADDLGELIDTLDLHQVILVGHSVGGGEVARYIGRHGTDRVAKVVLLSAVVPLMLKTPSNPNGRPIETFDQLRAATLHDRSQLLKDLAVQLYGYNRDGAAVSQGMIDSFWREGMQAGIKSLLDCITSFSETDFTSDLKRIDVPTLIAQGDDDQIVPIGLSALRSATLVKGATLKVYPGGPHGLAQVRQDEFNTDLLHFVESTGAFAYAASESVPPTRH